MMDQKSIANHRKNLIDAIDKWWNDEATDYTFPIVGENVIPLMAEAALSVLVAVSNTEDYLRSEGMLSEDD